MPAPVTAALQASRAFGRPAAVGVVPAAVQAEGEVPGPASGIKVQTFPFARAADAHRISLGRPRPRKLALVP